jgi:hypothetical protein
LKKDKTIQFLLIAAAVLLLLNIFVELIKSPGDDAANIPAKFNPARIENDFVKTLYSFGLQEDWIKETKAAKIPLFRIKVPLEIPITSILADLNSSLLYKDIKIRSQELKINGDAKLEISVNGSPILQAELKYDPKIFRKTSMFGIMLLNIDDLNEEEMRKLLNFPAQYSGLIIPNDANKNIAMNLVEYGKEYAALLNDNVKIGELGLNADYSKVRLKAAILQIVSDFSDAKLYLYDAKSDIAKSTSFAFIRQEFKKRGIALTPNNKHKVLQADSHDELASLMRFYIDSGQHNKEVFAMDAEDFLSIGGEILAQKKKGIKFVLPSQLNYGLSE